MITQALLHQTFNYDPETGVFAWKLRPSQAVHVGDVAGKRTTGGYIALKYQGKLIAAHRAAWLYVHGALPPKDTDHINGIKSDNRIANLRPATRSQNCGNQKRRCTNTSGCKGVNFDKTRGKWKARIMVDYRRHSLGYFDTPEDAAAAYARSAAEKFGEFARAA